MILRQNKNSFAMVSQQRQQRVPQPQWHAHWELSAVISGHLGWVRSIAFDPSNEWFVTGSADRTIKVIDLHLWLYSIHIYLERLAPATDMGFSEMLCRCGRWAETHTHWACTYSTRLSS